ncbi:hypothetical protein BDF14DRAFT_1845698 [Spinellus fusiger]|nr:hypothetical protein BDF14DRAFT_1845698 [Spinellus fusiger]
MAIIQLIVYSVYPVYPVYSVYPVYPVYLAYTIPLSTCLAVLVVTSTVLSIFLSHTSFKESAQKKVIKKHNTNNIRSWAVQSIYSDNTKE